MTNKEIATAISSDTISKKDNVYTVKWAYFWGIAKSGESKALLVKQAFPNANIITFGNHYAPFRGGAPVGRQSHFYVKFTLEKE